MTIIGKGAGAKPAGAESEQAAAIAVQEMFNSIAPRYDLINHLLSLNTDRIWWWRAARTFHATLRRPESQVVDVCCGTGDMTLALERRRPANGRPIIAVDFSHSMLKHGQQKLAEHNAVAIEGDALHLPLRTGSADLITSAFGFRNLSNYRAGLEEFARVLRPGGEIGILDFNEPTSLAGRLLGVYTNQVMPAVAGFISGQRAAYDYLPRSVGRFPAPAEMLDLMRECGFEPVSWTSYSFGLAGLYRGQRRSL